MKNMEYQSPPKGTTGKKHAGHQQGAGICFDHCCGLILFQSFMRVIDPKLIPEGGKRVPSHNQIDFPLRRDGNSLHGAHVLGNQAMPMTRTWLPPGQISTCDVEMTLVRTEALCLHCSVWSWASVTGWK